MRKLPRYTLLLPFLISFSLSAQTLDPVTEYYNRLKISKQNGGSETAFMSTGSEMLYGLEYFEAKKYDYASWRFQEILSKEPDNAFANFLFGISIAKLGRIDEAKPYVEKAVNLMPSLKDLAQSQLAKTEVTETKLLSADTPVKTNTPVKKVTTVAKPAETKTYPEKTAGGKLVYGNYACNYMQYQGRSFGAAFKPVYKGYFLLKADGTYRWLDNGATGRYSYDEKTGKITWLSGYFKNLKPIQTVFKDGKAVASIDIKLEESYEWGCACNK